MDLETKLRLSYYRRVADVSGAHGVVLVQHTESGRFYVMKSLQVYDRRVYECLLAKPCRGVPQIFELIEADGILYVVEEYVSGVSLRERLDREGALEEGEALRVMTALCAILAPLHAMTPPVIHRDIKPSNILLTADGTPMLVDFDAAKQASPGQQRDTELMGTAGYAAPEQYGFAPVTPAADVYALGVLFREMLTGAPWGERPYTGRFARRIARCTRMEPKDRYASAGELAEALGFHRTDNGRWRQWLPPGLGSRKPLVVVVSALWYAGIVSFALGDNWSGEIPRALEAVCAFLTLFLATLWVGNWRGIWRRIPLTRDRRRGVRALGVLLWLPVPVAAPIFIASLIVQILENLISA